MRTIIVVLTTTLALSCLVTAQAAQEPNKPKAAESAAVVPPKPAQRSVQLKSGLFQFKVRMDPAVPDPGHVVDVRIEMSEVPPVPDPIYGESIPVKDAQMSVDVIDADGAGYPLSILVHHLADAGAYGFHFTAPRRDTYRVVIKGEYKTKKFSPYFRMPVGIWPFKDVDAKGHERVVAVSASSSRMPALPGGKRGPAVPGSSGASASSGTSSTASPLSQAMKNMGDTWVELQVALLAGRRPDLVRAKSVASNLKSLVDKARPLVPADPDFSDLMQQASDELGKLIKQADSGKAKQALGAFENLGSRHCNRCHFVKRWKILSSPEEFPAMLP